MRSGVLEHMLDQVLCSDGTPAATDAVRIEQVPIAVPALATPLFKTFSAAYAQVQPDVAILPVSYEPDDVDDILLADVGAAKVFASAALEDFGALENAWVSPLFVAGVAVIYRLDNLSETLTLSPATLAGIYTRAITSWDDAAIAAENPGIAHLESTPIRLVSRSDSSQTTLVFTSVLHDVAGTTGVGPAKSFVVEGSYAVVESDSQVEAAVLFQDGALGYGAAIGDFSTAGSDVVVAADTIGHDGITRVELGTASLAACFDPSSADSQCWPFALTFDVSVPKQDVQDQCVQERSASLDFVSWLYDPDVAIAQPLESLGVVPISDLERDAFHAVIYDDCSSSNSSSTTKTRTSVIIIIVVCVIAALLAVAFLVVYQQRQQVKRQQGLILDLASSIEALKKHAFAMRSVVVDWSPNLNGAVVTAKVAVQRKGVGAVPVTRAVPAMWYWQEDPDRMKEHNALMTRPPHWVQYEGTVGAELECLYAQCQNNRIGTTKDVDLCDRISTTGTERKAFAEDSGYNYVIDVHKMTQTNKKTGWERNVLRVPAQADGVVAAAHQIDPIDDEVKGDEYFGEQEQPIIPADIDADEPFLELKAGSLVQTVKQRHDGWVYGSVIVEAEEAVQAPTTTNNAHLVEMTDVGPPKKFHVSKETGWFPMALTEEPGRDALARLADQVGQGSGSFLETPEYWSPVKDPLIAERFRLADGDEKHHIVEYFLSTLDRRKVKVKYVDRVQNEAMFKSYAVKRQTVLQREVVNHHEDSRYERTCWHGTNQDTIPKIIQQGFNRSFCGKNATAYGKGVYFARDAQYSAHRTYSVPNSQGHQFIFMARVTIGEYCRGRRDVLTPDVRDAASHQLYDSTVDNVTNPSLYVTYHDAQAYPEYLICFTQSS